MAESKPKNVGLGSRSVGPGHVSAALGDLRAGAADEDRGAGAMLELAALGAHHRELVLLTAASIGWPSSATLGALPRQDIAILFQGKSGRRPPMPLRAPPAAAAWLAKRARAAPAAERLFSEAMSRRAMQALGRRAGGRIGWQALRRLAAREALEQASRGHGDGAAGPPVQ